MNLSYQPDLIKAFQPLWKGRERYKGVHGGRGCVHPDTQLETPAGCVPISKFEGGPVYAWQDGQVVVADASPGFPCTEEDLYRVELEDGRSIIATPAHRFLTPNGWMQLSQLAPGDDVLSPPQISGASRPPTTAGSDLQAWSEGALRCWQRAADWMGRCCWGLRRCGQQPLVASDIGQVAAPSQAGGRQHTRHAGMRGGGLAGDGSNTPSRPWFRLSSRVARLASAVRCCADGGSYSAGISSGWLSAFSPVGRRSHARKALERQAQRSCGQHLAGGTRQGQAQSLQTLGRMLQRGVRGRSSVSPVKVRLIDYHDRLTYWDIHVPGPENYLAHGFINHNSGKSHDRAQACVLRMLEGRWVLGAREVQNTIADSVKQLVESYIGKHELGEAFTIQRDRIECVTGGRMIFRGLRDYNAESIKSLEGYTVAWVEEAQTVTDRSWRLLTPTIRGEGSEIWCSWNRRYEHDAVDVFFRENQNDPDVLCVHANFDSNPYFPTVLQRDMERDREKDPLLYEHIWLGGYVQIGEGAYYANQLAKLRMDGRITSLPVEPEPPIYTGWDLGIDDMTSIWVCQPVGHEIRIIDYYEGRGEDAAHYAHWLLERGYNTGDALLPHDAGKRDYTLKTYETHLRDAGLTNTRVLPRATDVMGDIQRTRSFLSRCWFDEHRCRDGLLALGSYRVEMDHNLRTPKMKPVHDWASHPADAFRSLATLSTEQLRPGTTSYDRRIDINTGARRESGPIRGIDRSRRAQRHQGRGRLGIRSR